MNQKLVIKYLFTIPLLFILINSQVNAEVGGELTHKEYQIFSDRINEGDTYSWTIETNFTSEHTGDKYQLEVIENPVRVNYSDSTSISNLETKFELSLNSQVIDINAVLLLFFIQPIELKYSNSVVVNVFEEMAENDLDLGFYLLMISGINENGTWEWDRFEKSISNGIFTGNFYPHDEDRFIATYQYDIGTGILLSLTTIELNGTKFQETKMINNNPPGLIEEISSTLNDVNEYALSQYLQYTVIIVMLVLFIVLLLHRLKSSKTDLDDIAEYSAKLKEDEKYNDR